MYNLFKCDLLKIEDLIFEKPTLEKCRLIVVVK